MQIQWPHNKELAIKLRRLKCYEQKIKHGIRDVLIVSFSSILLIFITKEKF